MLTLTADVNGRVIAKVFIHNTGRESCGGHYYDAAGISFYPSGVEQDMAFGVENVWHKREWGWAPLVEKVLERGNL